LDPAFVDWIEIFDWPRWINRIIRSQLKRVGPAADGHLGQRIAVAGADFMNQFRP
jgi:hypothetical protein